jgi:hypothetical protein
MLHFAVMTAQTYSRGSEIGQGEDQCDDGDRFLVGY